MAFHLIYILEFIVCLGFSFGKLQKYGKTAFFPGGYGRNWGNTTRAAMAGLRSIG